MPDMPHPIHFGYCKHVSCFFTFNTMLQDFCYNIAMGISTPVINSISGAAGIIAGSEHGNAANTGNTMADIFNIFNNYWFAVLLVFMLAVLLVVFSRNGISRLSRHLKSAALAIWTAGLFLYMYGFNEEGSVENNSLILFLRASLSSMEMFVSHSDLIEVKKELHHDVAYMVPFTIVHFCAVLVSAVFIIRLLGLRIVSWLRLVSWRVFSPLIKDKPCFVFFGIDSNGIMLAKSIRRRFGKDCRIIFVNLPDGGHKHGHDRFTFSHFFHSSGEGAAIYADDIEELNALMFNAEKRVADISVNNTGKGSGETVFGIFGKLGLSVPFIRTFDFLICRFAERRKVEFFFMSDDEAGNISSVLALKSLAGDGKGLAYNNFRCYCHARRNNINTALLRHGGLKERIHLVDSSYLSIIKLMKDVRNHPVSFVDIDTGRGVARTGFTGMVIGFNETGRDAFRFMYEFSSFVCDDAGTANRKTIYVADENMERMKAEFLTYAPALKEKGCDTIDWWDDTSTRSTAFWEKLRQIIDDLNYLVITVGNDDEAMSLAYGIYEFAFRYRKDLNRFGVFVRLKDTQKGCNIRRISDIIVPFGADRDIFDYGTMSADVLEKHAIRFFYNYEKNNIRNMKAHDIPEYTAELERLTGTGGTGERIEAVRAAIRRMNTEIAKFEEIDGARGKTDDEKGLELWLHRRFYKPDGQGYTGRTAKEDDIEVAYKEEQDKSNVWHVLTKRALTRYADFGKIASEPVLLTNFNYCEHLRWNAKMELLGFLPGEKRDYRKRVHPCIVDCKTLAEKFGYTIPFDQAVVELSFSRTSDIELQD